MGGEKNFKGDFTPYATLVMGLDKLNNFLHAP